MMSRLISYISLITYLSARVRAAIGPVTDLHIVNTQLSPDGYKREYVHHILLLHPVVWLMSVILQLCSTTVAEGQFPGPLIKGNKGDTFKINVFDDLHDDAMLLPTSIVRFFDDVTICCANSV